tara:strand:+ start:112 stop:231 length:120 start_codon:yes stop_codon:yes gene_type:complete
MTLKRRLERLENLTAAEAEDLDQFVEESGATDTHFDRLG